MALADFDALFDLFDPAGKGFISAKDVHQIYESIHFDEVDIEHVRRATKMENGNSTDCDVKKAHFSAILREVSRRVEVEEMVRWDFRALDSKGSHRIPIQDALILLQNTHGECFSMTTWRRFMAARGDSVRPVSFDELRMWLCDRPDDRHAVSGDNEMKTEHERLAELQNNNTTRDYHQYQNSLPETVLANRKEEHEENVKRGARRKFKKWENEGVHSVLYDDGIDRGEEVRERSGAAPGINDLLDKLEVKYRMLRTKLFWSMIQKQSALLSDSEQVDTFQQLQLEEKQLRRGGRLAEGAKDLAGAGVTQPLLLSGLMGVVGSQLEQLMVDLNERRMELRNSGREETEIELNLKNEFELKIKGPLTSGDMLVHLHSRWMKEKDDLIQRLRSNHSKSNKTIVEYGRLERQYTQLELEEEFLSAATSTGLAERPQESTNKRFNPDRVHQERLAASRLMQSKGHKLKLPTDSPKAMKGSTSTDLIARLIREISWKQANEREVLIQLLLGSDSAAAKAAARQLSKPERHHKVTSLRNQRTGWRNGSSQYRNTHRTQQIKILQDGVGLYYENVRSSSGSSDNVACSIVLADLQQAQDEEFEQLLNNLHGKKEKELENLMKAEQASRTEEHLDTLARVLLGVFEMTELEKPFIMALDAKYDALRQVLLQHALKTEHGLAWQRLGEDEKQRLLVKRQNEERRLRHDGRFTEMEQMISSISDKLGSNLRRLMGETKGEFYQRKALYEEKRDHALVRGLPIDETLNDEPPEEQNKTSNYLADLLQRYYIEQNSLLSWIRSAESKNQGPAHQQLPLVLLKLEAKICEREDNFEVAAMVVGLMERVDAATDLRHLTDQRRHEKLSALRTDKRKKRVEIGEQFQKELDEYARPEKGNQVAWMESFIWEQSKKHVEERELLLSILQDAGLEELIEVVHTMSPTECSSRLAELRTKRNKMNVDNMLESEENYSIIEEAAAIRCVMKREFLSSKKPNVTNRDITVELLKELHDEQDREAATYINKLADMSEKQLKKGREYEINSRHWQAGENVIQVLTRHEGEAEDDALLKALDEKYDVMRDKLLIEALMKQCGEAEWKSLTEKERQQKLVQLKLREKQLRRDGKLEELSKLLGDSLARDEALRKIMGESRAEYERRLQEKLARRQKRIAEGLDPDEEDEELEHEEVNVRSNPLLDLQSRYEDEKEALLRRLRGLDDAYLSEKERQAQLLRLKREKRGAEREDKFDNAARLLGLAERQQGELSEKLKNDRLRHEQLARERLESLKKKRKTLTYSEDVLRNGTNTELQDSVMKRLDDRHTQEHQLLVEFLSHLDSDPDARLLAQASSSLERQDLLNKLCEQRSTSLDSAQENHSILKEACVYKFEMRRDVLNKEDQEVNDEEVTVSLLADLQQRQEKEAEDTLQQITEMEISELLSLQIKIIEECKQQRADNVAEVVFAEQKDEQNALLAALDSKYDALREKLLIEGLMAELGEMEWRNMSEEERQRKLAETKLKERQLRRAGRYDEAEKLYGDALKNHEALQDLMGENRLEQEKRLKERLERRKQRKAQGMSEEECNRLEQEEIVAENKEAKKKRNVLLDLMKNYDAEEEALLWALRESENKAEREKRRQLEMARLKREERKAKLEANYDAAAIVLGLAQKQKNSMEAERLRQEQLAKERLAARRAGRKVGQQEGAGEEGKEEKVPLPNNTEDTVALQDAIIQELELKHNSERDLLLQVMEEAKDKDALRAMPAEQLTEKLEELRQLRALWRSQTESDAKDQLEYLKDGIAPQMEQTRRKLEAEGKSQTEEAIEIALLADLQQYQEQETRVISHNFSNAESSTLIDIKEVEFLSRQKKWYDNLAKAVLGTDIESTGNDGLSQEEREVVHALEKKYDAARDKLLMEALMKEAGEREWTSLSQQEKHRRLVKLRLEEKKLRREGKYNEAAALLGKMSQDQEALNQKLGETRSEQKKRLDDQLRRRAELKAEREAKGMSTDETLINALVEQEMVEEEKEKAKRMNILENLDHHYEDEKEALLAALRGQQDRDTAERRRQLQLAKLKRDQRRMAKEEKFDSAALLLSMAEERDKKREEGYVNQRERQRQLAQERLAARRQRKMAGTNCEDERLTQTEEKLEAALEATSTDDVPVENDLLDEIEAKQSKERNVFMDLLKELEDKKHVRKKAKELGEESARMQLEQSRLDQIRWYKESRKTSMRLNEATTESEKDVIRKSIQLGKNDQHEIHLPALAIRLEMEIAVLKKSNLEGSDETLRAEAGLSLLTELQMKQEVEVSAVEKLVHSKDGQVLAKLRDVQHQSKEHAWFVNLNSTVFTVPSHLEDRSEEEQQSSNDEKLEKQLEEELSKEKEDYKKKLLASGNEVDVEAALKELEEQQAAKKKALQDTMRKQQKQLKERLDARRMAQEAAEYEEETAIALVRNADRDHSFVLEKKQKEKGRQQDLMQQRLTARREARRKAQEAESTVSRETSDMTSATSSYGSLPGGRMRREKTVLDVEVSEDKKKELFSQVVRDHEDWSRKVSADQQRQQELLKRRLENRTNKRQDEVDAVFSLGQRQKTILERTKQEERERQITAMKERVARVRYERTMTMKDGPGNKNARKFDDLLGDERSGKLTQDERMSLAAKKMQDKFQEEEKMGAAKFASSDETTEADGKTDNLGKPGPEGHKILNKEEKMALLKQRRLEKKRQRQEASNNE